LLWSTPRARTQPAERPTLVEVVQHVRRHEERALLSKPPLIR
jgi:hypothetical protein